MYNSDDEIKHENNILIKNEIESSEECDDDIFMKNINKQKKNKEIQENLDNEIDELFTTNINKNKKDKDLENLINEL